MMLHHALKETEKIVHKNYRMGISVTGVCQIDWEKWKHWLDRCYTKLENFDIQYSKKYNIPPSVALTTVKPEGSVGKLSGATPGIHTAYARHYIQRIRFSLPSKQVELYKSLGYPHEYDQDFTGKLKKNTMVISFPCKYPKTSRFTKDMTAIDQLELVKEMQTYWSDNAVSCTVYYRKEELDGIKEWLNENYHTSLKSISFCLHSEHGFKLPPYEEITKEEYKVMKNNIKPVPTYQEEKFKEKSQFPEGTFVKDDDCPNGSCSMR